MTTIVLEVPDELNGFELALKELVAVAVAQLRRAGGRGPARYAAFETDIAAALGGVERSVHAAALTALDIDTPRLAINGVDHVRVMREATTFFTLAGGASVVRTLYRPAGARNAPVVDVVALRVGAIEKVWLPATARAMAFLLQQGTSREAEASAEQIGRLPYSHTSFQNVGQAVGRRFVGMQETIEEALIAEYEIPAEAQNVSVSLDRVAVPMEEPRKRPVGRPREGAAKRPIQVAYRMAYCGTVTLHDGKGEALHTIRYGTMAGCDARSLCEGMADDVLHLLAQRPSMDLSLLCDGAPEMWNLLDAQFNEASFGRRPTHRLVDFWHLIEKLSFAARVIFDTDETRKQATTRWRSLLLNRSDAAPTIHGELTASGKEHVAIGDKEPVHEVMTYITNHGKAERLNYAASRRLGLPIGSGNVEATCKTLVSVRMKRSGARWKIETGNHIIALRALAQSDRWDHAMDLTLDPAKLSLRRAA